LLPLMVGRYAIPLILARRVLAAARPPEIGSTWWSSAGALAVKLATLTLVTAGSAVFDPTTEPFSGAVQNLLALSVLALALVYEPRTAAPTSVG
jgi:hypothetical protein